MKIYQKARHKFVDELMDLYSGRDEKEVKPVGVMDLFLIELSLKQISRSLTAIDLSYGETTRIIESRAKKMLASLKNHYSTHTTIVMTGIISYYAESFLKVLLKRFDVQYRTSNNMKPSKFNEKVDNQIKDCSYISHIKKMYFLISQYKIYTGTKGYAEDDLNLKHLPLRIEYAHELTQLINEIINERQV